MLITDCDFCTVLLLDSLHRLQKPPRLQLQGLHLSLPSSVRRREARFSYLPHHMGYRLRPNLEQGKQHRLVARDREERRVGQGWDLREY